MKAMVLACLLALGFQDAPPDTEETPPDAEVKLKSGDILHGRLVDQTDAEVILDHAVLGELKIPTADVEAVVLVPVVVKAAEPPPEEEPAAKPPVEEEPTAEPPAEEEKEKPEWKWRFDLGFTGSAGVTNETSLRVGLTGRFRDPLKFYRVDSAYILKTTDSETTDNEFNADVLGDWKFKEKSKWGYFGQSTFDWDQFQSWDYRVTAHGGLSYLLLDLDKPQGSGNDFLDLVGRFGLGGNKEFGSIDEDFQAEAMLQGELNCKLSERSKLTFRVTYYPDADTEDFGEFRLTSRAEWAYDLEILEGLAFVVGYNYEYQSRTDPGVDPNDLNIYLSLGMNF